MVDAPGRNPPRFPAEEIPRVTSAIRDAMDGWQVGEGTTLIAGGARGADLIAAEQALVLGAKIRIVLALPVEEFECRSVALPGTDWVARFRHVLERAESEVIDAASDTNAFAQANARIIEAAHELDERPKAIIVWNGQEGDGPSGTRDFIGRLGFSGPNERACVIDPTPRAYERRETPGPAKKLLALDGGGIRGALSLEILAALESRLRARYGSQLVLADYFDYIGGTSTGAIIAAALALGKPVDEVRASYETLGPRVFKRRALPMRARSLYRDGPLTEELTSFFGGECTLGDPRLRTLLLAVLHNTVTDSVWPLNNFTGAKYNRADRYLKDPPDRNLDLSLTTVIRGSTAAPMYFAPQELAVGDHEFVFQDGGVTPFNNPAMLMFLTATLPEYGLGWPAGEDAMLVVSVGTGSSAAVHPGLSPRKVKLSFHVKNLPSVFMNGASVGQDLLCRSVGRTRFGAAIDRELGDRVGAAGIGASSLFTYLRYNADLSAEALSEIGITDPRKQQALRKLDAVDRMPELQALGARVGQDIDLERHFEGFL